jgi:thioester reductase-like protein
LHAEAALDPDIVPAPERGGLIGEPKVVLLTGATGFMGAFLLHELLARTQARVVCLVRAPDSTAGLARITKNLAAYGLESDVLRSRIIAMPGDIARQGFGLSADCYQRLTRTVDTVYHGAAVLNYVYPYRHLRAANVCGTREALRFACRTRAKAFHYLSSFAVFNSPAYAGRTVTEADPAAHNEGIYLGYSQSKWVAERLVQAAQARGLPAVIYRLPLVSCDSRTGAGPTDDVVWRIVKSGIQMRCMSDLDYPLHLLPVDYAVASIVYLAQRAPSAGEIFHLDTPRPVTLKNLAEWMREFGYPIRIVPYQIWLERLRGASGGDNNALNPLLPFFLRRWSEQNLTLLELFRRGQPRIDCATTLEILAAASLVCPPVDSALLGTYFSHFIRSGFLDAPGGKS